MISYKHAVAVPLNIALAFSLLLTACKKSAPPPEQNNNPAGQSASNQAGAPQGAMSTQPGAPSAAQAPAPAPEAAPAPPPPPPPVPRIVPAGTSFSMRLSNSLSSKSNNAGDPFRGSLVNSVRLNGDVLIPAGSTVHGVVISAHSAGKFKGAATMALKLVSVVVHGQTYPISSRTISAETKGKGKRTGAMIGGGAGGGALIGGIAGGGKGALIGGLVGAGAGTAGAAMTGNNRDISYPAESVLPFRLSSSLDLGPGPVAETNPEQQQQPPPQQ